MGLTPARKIFLCLSICAAVRLTVHIANTNTVGK